MDSVTDSFFNCFNTSYYTKISVISGFEIYCNVAHNQICIVFNLTTFFVKGIMVIILLNFFITVARFTCLKLYWPNRL